MYKYIDLLLDRGTKVMFIRLSTGRICETDRVQSENRARMQSRFEESECDDVLALPFEQLLSKRVGVRSTRAPLLFLLAVLL